MITKQLIWVGSSKKDLAGLPDSIKDTFGYGLYLAQKGERYSSTKVLKGFGGTSIIEIKDSDNAGTYRAIYTIQMKEVVFVLHVFQKKSNQGIKTPHKDIALIESRLKEAQEIYKELFKKDKKS